MKLNKREVDCPDAKKFASRSLTSSEETVGVLQ
jgi:hypothetical protein